MKRAWISLAIALASVSMAQEPAPRPDAELKAIEYLVGKFDTKDKMHMSPTETVESKGTSDSKWVLMKRYISMDNTGTMGGVPFEGHMMVTYNEMAKRYECSWFDSMGGASLKAKGQIKDGVLEMVSDPYDAGGPPMIFRLSYKPVNKHEVSFKLEMKMGEGAWTDVISSTYMKKT